MIEISVRRPGSLLSGSTPIHIDDGKEAAAALRRLLEVTRGTPQHERELMFGVELLELITRKLEVMSK